MKSRVVGGLVLLVGLSGVVTFASVGTHVTTTQQWAIVDIREPVGVYGTFLMGRYLIAHDEAKMARGEPCTTIYRFEAGKGPKEAIVTFMCIPAQRAIPAQTTLALRTNPATGLRELTEYQFAGDSEAHGVPLR